MSQSSRTASSVFRVATSADDYDACDRLLRQESLHRTMISFPTIMAFEADELVGFLGTRIEKRMIVAGPLAMRSDRRRIFTALRLCEAYELSMLNLGILRFIFQVHAGSMLDRGIKRYYPLMAPYAIKGDSAFYVWRLDDGRRRSLNPSTERGGAGASASAGGSA